MKRSFWTAGLLTCGLAGFTLADDISPANLFQQLDKNQDGKLVAEEIPDGQQRFFERVVRIGDENGDGSITAEEFSTALKPAPPSRETSRSERGNVGGNRPDPEEIFKRLDRNNDGKLTREELPERAQDRLGPLFDKLGTDSMTLKQFQETGRMAGRKANGDRPGRDGQKPPRDGKGPDGKGPDGRGLGGQRPPRDGKRMERDGAGPREGMGRPPFGHRPPEFLRILDEDGNGTLSQQELANAATALKQLDHNDDGELDHAELMGIRPPDGGDRPEMDGERGPGDRGPGGRGPGDRVPGQRGPGRGNFDPGQMFHRIDADQDGFVSKDEAPERMQQHFSKLDTNNDGKLSQEELRNGMQGNRRQRPGGGPNAEQGERGNRPGGPGSNSRPQRPE